MSKAPKGKVKLAAVPSIEDPADVDVVENTSTVEPAADALPIHPAAPAAEEPPEDPRPDAVENLQPGEFLALPPGLVVRPASPVVTANVEVPLWSGDPPGRSPRHVDIQLSAAQAQTMRRLFLALESQAARIQTRHGTRLVGHTTDAVRWLLDQITAPEDADDDADPDS